MRKNITSLFNIVSTFGLFTVLAIHFMFIADLNRQTQPVNLIDILFEDAGYAVLFHFLLVLMVAVTISLIFREIWNRLIVDVFSLRSITFNEAYALCFLLTSVVLI
ncbi:hypothetical protein OE749_03065 [Aestuariibacter sp. AA17]|uniref:Uncharacterized protein n=1 Tax=Fluctibacter corallii TaxID=2984329 RepID=A0ABT3A5P4_9ALTE|nr:hypothetical protein [Aestuariibacter sp. AA17]MCV2883681.1 hypothetical protein [Aestuariibacter sp. AA17]